MMTSKVFFLSYKNSNPTTEGLEKLFKKLPLKIEKNELTAVKVHMGELGNATYIKPAFVRKVVEEVINVGGRPFVTDTTTLYPKARFTAIDYLNTAAVNGFTPKSIGAPIIIADGLRGYDGIAVKLRQRIRGCELGEIEVAKAIWDSDFLAVISHVKGHGAAGFGGAIKNLGMGCTTKQGKAAIHKPAMANINVEKCRGCGTCLKLCAYGAINLVNGKSVKDLEKCTGCEYCAIKCPNKAFTSLPDAPVKLQTYLAHGAEAVMEKFRVDKIWFLDVVQDVTPLCDCTPSPGAPIIEDVGLLVSRDPVAVDAASLDLVDQAKLRSFSAEDGPDRLGRLHGINSRIQLSVAEELGIGTQNYELIRVQ